MLLPAEIANVVSNRVASRGLVCAEGVLNQPERLESRIGEDGRHSTNKGSLKQLSLETVLTDADVRRLLRILSVR